MKYVSVLVLFAIYLLLGNIMRLVPMASSIGSFNVLEMFLHGYCLIILVFSISEISSFPKSLIAIYFFFFISYLLGSLRIQEINFVAFTYNVRIFLFFTTSFALALSFHKVWNTNFSKVLNYFIALFLINSIVAWIIYFAFPESALLWAFLENFGIIFNGDPHIHRLLGTLFDPNFFGNILILPILYCLYLYETTKSKKYFFFLFFLLLTELFTFSRSSLFGLVLALSFFYLLDIKQVLLSFRIKKSIVAGLFASLLGLILAIIYFPDEVERISERFLSIGSDESAQFRLSDFLLALDLLSDIDILFFGIGFNFFSYLDITSTSSIDSSILSLLVTLGLPIFLITMLLFFRFFKLRGSAAMDHSVFWKRVLLNFLFVSLVISNFNNLLLYPFWVFSVLPIVCYFHILKENS